MSGETNRPASNGPQRPKPERLVTTGHEKWFLVHQVIESFFSDSFLHSCLSDPEESGFEIDWMAEGMPKIELFFAEADARERTAENRRAFVRGFVRFDDARIRHRFERIWAPGLINEINVKWTSELERSIGTFQFRIRPPISAKRIRDAILTFGIELENAGVRCNSPLQFDAESAWKNRLDERKKREARWEVLAMEEIESIEKPDLTQVRQALDKILRNIG